MNEWLVRVWVRMEVRTADVSSCKQQILSAYECAYAVQCHYVIDLDYYDVGDVIHANRAIWTP